MKNGFICPKCKAPLTVSGGSLRCPDGHCYDISSGGYVNLLLSNMMNSKLPGDNKLMVNARRAFLNKGFYRPLADITAKPCCGMRISRQLCLMQAAARDITRGSYPKS